MQKVQSFEELQAELDAQEAAEDEAEAAVRAAGATEEEVQQVRYDQ